MVKRIGLFLLTNLLIITTISIVIRVLGIDARYLSNGSLDYAALMKICLVWGMTGSVISLALSRVMAKWAMGVQVLKPGQAGQFEWLCDLVNQLAKSAGLPKTPEVGIYNSPEMNAFATGPTRNRALIAFSSGILSGMDRDQIAGVAGHEMAHIANGDMVTMTLLQGIINAFVMFLSRVISFAISQGVKEEHRGLVNMLVPILLDIFLSILGSLVVCWFSRQREFRADKGGAQYAGRERMASALRRLADGRLLPEAHPSLATMKISGRPGGFLSLFATHPPLALRLQRLSTP
ncbi:MAG: protease HtpX [Oligoflexia bacterium]|nr:protease HtpX [Oligoflexia bacterium]